MMEKFITKKRRSSDVDHSAAVTVESESTSERKTKKIRLFCHSYLNIRFTWDGEEAQPIPHCLMCDAKLSNEAIVPSRLNGHFTNIHGHLSGKSPTYFKRLLDERKRQSQAYTKTFKISTKAQEASYLVAEIIAKISKLTQRQRVLFFLLAMQL